MPKVLYRADGGHPVGTGHILRGLRISACWTEIAPNYEVLLVAQDNTAVRKLVSEVSLSNLRTHFLDDIRLTHVPELDAGMFESVVADYAPDIIVVDMLDTPELDMSRLRKMTDTLVTLDDRGPGRFHAHLICNFLVRDPDPSTLPDSTWLLEGSEYASLSLEFAEVKRGRKEPEFVRRVLVSLGGADAAGLTVKVAEELFPIEGIREVDFVLGAAFCMQDKLEAVLSKAPWKANLHVALPSLLPLFSVADLAIVAGGITMHEAACCGVPAIAVCQSIDHQLMVAGWLEKAGCMLNLGYGEQLSTGKLTAAVNTLFDAQQKRQSMSDAGPRICDGRGSMRTAQAIIDLHTYRLKLNSRLN